jgi:pimeloyl-ACP methyl ester carboxylesterase
MNKLLIGVISLLLLNVAAGAEEVWQTLPKPPAMPTPVDSGMAPVNDIQMYYAVYGEGEPVLLIHGGLGHADVWGFQVPALAESHKVIVADSRGHGRSTRSEKPFDYALMADDYLALLDHLGIDKVALVGWSDGGIIGLDIAIRHPERLARLFAFAANYTPAGVRPSVANDPTFNAYIARAGEDYARLSPTPDEFDAFVEQISQMWARELQQGPAARDHRADGDLRWRPRRGDRARAYRRDGGADPGGQARDHEGRQPLRDVAAPRRVQRDRAGLSRRQVATPAAA